MIMKFLPSNQLSHEEMATLAEDIGRLGRNPAFKKIIDQPVEFAFFNEKRTRKQDLRLLAQTEVRRRSLVQRLMPRSRSYGSAWMIMLDLFLHQDDPRGVSVKSASLASGLPSTTALRFIDELEQAGLVTSEWSEDDRRRKMLSLTPDGHATVTRILLALENLLDPLEGSKR